MIKLYKSNEINRQKWDECIRRSQNPLIYALSWYLDEMSENWMALIEDDFQSVFPLCYKKRLFFKRINQPIFVQQLGLFSKKKQSKELFESFICQIPKTFFGSFINCNYTNFAYLELYNASTKNNYVMCLAKTYTFLYQSFSENHKRNIKKAIQNQLIIKENNNSINEICLFYEHHLTHVYKSICQKVWDNFKNLCTKAMHQNKCFCISIQKEHQNLCMAVFFIYENRITYILGAANDAGKKNGANHFLINYVIQKYASSAYFLDFEGSNSESLARFYAGFGAKNEPYFRLEL